MLIQAQPWNHTYSSMSFTGTPDLVNLIALGYKNRQIGLNICDCTTCRYEWSLISQAAVGDSFLGVSSQWQSCFAQSLVNMQMFQDTKSPSVLSTFTLGFLQCIALSLFKIFSFLFFSSCYSITLQIPPNSVSLIPWMLHFLLRPALTGPLDV